MQVHCDGGRKKKVGETSIMPVRARPLGPLRSASGRYLAGICPIPGPQKKKARDEGGLEPRR
jgi:hypothetical protein